MISCKYKNLGCEVGLKRKEKEAMEVHEQDDKVHLRLALSKAHVRQDIVKVFRHFNGICGIYDLAYAGLKIYRYNECIHARVNVRTEVKSIYYCMGQITPKYPS